MRRWDKAPRLGRVNSRFTWQTRAARGHYSRFLPPLRFVDEPALRGVGSGRSE
jgi:hypothetical protein